MTTKRDLTGAAFRSIFGVGLKKLNGSPQGLKILDTNVLVHDPKAPMILQQDGIYGIVLAPISLNELDYLKYKHPNLSGKISEVGRLLNCMMEKKDPNLYIVQGDISKFPELDPANNDHQIIATYLTIKQQHPNLPLVLITDDILMHALANTLKINVQEHCHKMVDVSALEHPLPLINIPGSTTFSESCAWPIKGYKKDFIPENGGAVIISNGSVRYPCIRKGDSLRQIRMNISAAGIVPYTLEENETNWEMYLALEQLLDPQINFVTLLGKAGTCKTLLAIAAAIQQRKMYKTIYVTRPCTRLDDCSDELGFLPGELNSKLDP